MLSNVPAVIGSLSIFLSGMRTGTQLARSGLWLQTLRTIQMAHVESLERLGTESNLDSAASVQTVAGTEQDVVTPSQVTRSRHPRIRMSAFSLLSSTISQTQERERAQKPKKRHVTRKREEKCVVPCLTITNVPASETVLP